MFLFWQQLWLVFELVQTIEFRDLVKANSWSILDDWVAYVALTVAEMFLTVIDDTFDKSSSMTWAWAETCDELEVLIGWSDTNACTAWEDNLHSQGWWFSVEYFIILLNSNSMMMMMYKQWYISQVGSPKFWCTTNKRLETWRSNCNRQVWQTD